MDQKQAVKRAGFLTVSSLRAAESVSYHFAKRREQLGWPNRKRCLLMPTVHNGIGTWYYGKRRIHTRNGTCEFCGRSAALSSYDTSLFFVIFFFPIIPLNRKRILQQCSVCTRHRSVDLGKWEEAKAKDSAELLEKLQRNPNDRETILRAIGFTLAYQDEPLFDNIVETLGIESTRDAAVQAQLGAAYGYFSRWAQAEQAYRAALALEDNDSVREQLALTLIKQKRPPEARPYLQHVITGKKAGSAGLIYLLADAYQTEGMHQDALAVMDERDQAFPEFAKSKDYQRQRTTSIRYRDTNKKTRSAVAAGSKSGYSDGNWTASMPRWIATLVILSIPAIYFGSAIWIGQSRRVYLVNGVGQTYGISVQGTNYDLPPNSVTPIHVPEGDIQVSFRDAKAGLEPVNVHIETSFWTRPFGGHTFVINPDRSAIIIEESALFAAAKANVNANAPREDDKPPHYGQTFYSLAGFDYEFQNFPQTLQINEHEVVRKTRVTLEPALTPEARFNVMQKLTPEQQVPFCKTVLRLDPHNEFLLGWLAMQLPDDEFLTFVESRLDDRPILVDWHHVYQTQTARAHPEKDLRPRYRKLVADTNGTADAVYLLGRCQADPDESDKLYQQAASATPPSGYAMLSLGSRALSAGKFPEACKDLEKAKALLTNKSQITSLHQEALLANGDFDGLLKALETSVRVPGRKEIDTLQIMRVHAIRGDLVKARKAMTEIESMRQGKDGPQFKQALASMLSCCQDDAAGFQKALGNTRSFESEFLKGKTKEAADLVEPDDLNSIAYHGLLYLQATRSGAVEVAGRFWNDLLADLNKGTQEERILAKLLSDKKPIASRFAQRAHLEPSQKRVLLAVLAQRYPAQAKEMLPLASKLNYQHDAISLCLRKFLEKS